MVTFSAESVDDLLHDTLRALIQEGDAIEPSRGDALESRGARLELRNPRARLSRSHARGRVFSCLGELAWYLSGSGRAEDIEYYVSAYGEEAEADGNILAAYGTRLFADEGRLQVAIETLRSKRDSRQAVIPLLDAADLKRSSGHVPCTSTLQFLLRQGQLDAVVFMRSNDAYLGLPHDVFAFTMIQEIVARSLDADLGTYVHMVGSLHLYERNRLAAERFLDEGFSSPTAMPPMPEGDPWPAVEELLRVEKRLRTGGEISVDTIESPYWGDLARLLATYALFKRGLPDLRASVNSVRTTLNSQVYDVFLNDKFGILEV